jgi:ribonuclease VapC
MIVDPSALLAIVFNEPEALDFSLVLNRAKTKFIAAPNYLEAIMAATRLLAKEGATEIENLVFLANIKIVAFDRKIAMFAVSAFLKYGKGQGHPAQLNFGDCMACAAAKIEGLSLLFKGNDFNHTDVERVT